MYKLFALTFLVGLIGTAAGEPAKRPAAKTIVLVHGAFADGSSWDGVTPLLLAKGYNVVAVHAPLSSLAEDVAATKRVIDAQPGPIILVGHSYGGVIITEAGMSDKVVGLVYVAAFAPDAGESVLELGKNSPPPAYQKTLVVDASGYGTLPPDTVATQFAQDVSPAEARLMAAKQGPTQVKNFGTPVTAAAWHTKPSWYVRAENDRMIDPAGQAFMAKRIGATVTNVKASHVVMVSKPIEVANVILTAAAGK
jgi:pimeloyl-ACP methyl ester carboxylesterase